MKKLTTKEKILHSALNLFSQKGFDGVGVDQIAEEVGIKGPAMYRYFKGKEDLLNKIIDTYEQHYSENMKSRNDVVPSDLNQLKEFSLKQINFTLHDENIIKMRKIMSMEQFKNKRIAQLASKHTYEDIVNMYTGIFTKMVEAGYMKKYDPRELAFEYATPISTLISLCDRQPEREKEVLEIIVKHFDHFIEIYSL